MAEMVGKTGKVVGIEHIPELVEQSKQNIKRGNADLLDSGQVVLVTGDGRQGYGNGKWKGNRKSQNFDMLGWQNGSRDGAVVSALTFHTNVAGTLSLLLVLSLGLWGLSPGTPVFFPIPQEMVKEEPMTLW